MKTRGFVYLLAVTLCIGAGWAWAGHETDQNTWYGQYAGASITSGLANTLIGYGAGNLVSTASSNTFVGYDAGLNNTAGFNTFIGAFSGYSNTTGTDNAFLGYYTGIYNTTGYSNTFMGREAGVINTTGIANTYVGHQAGLNANGSGNTLVGNETGYLNATGWRNVMIGEFAGYNNLGGNNVFIGWNAGANETGDNRLYIDNSNTATPLIYGEFDNKIVTINGKLGIGTKTPQEKIDLGGGKITLNGADNTGAMPPGLSSQSYDAGRIDFGYGGSGGGNLEAYSKAPVNYSGADDRRGQFRFVYGGGPTLGKVLYIHYDGTTWSNKMSITYDGQLQMTPDGHNVGAYTDGHTWFNSSSRAYKENIRDFSVDEAMDTLKELSPVKFNYKVDSRETHVGFIAEDVPALVATSDRKGMSPMDVVAVLTKVVQEQKKALKELRAENKELKETLESRLLAIERMVIAPK
jgi:hypothetical protein